MDTNTSHSTQKQRDTLVGFARSYNTRYKMVGDLMQISLYNRYAKVSPETLQHVAVVDPFGQIDYKS
jgi:hypothetical protein